MGDICLAAIQFIEFTLYGYDGIIFIVAGCMFSLDALLLIWLISYKGNQDNAPRYVWMINVISNASTIIAYSIGRVFIVFRLRAAKDATTNQRIIAATLFVLSFPLKCIKLYIMFKYKQFCKSGITQQKNEKYNQLLSKK